MKATRYLALVFFLCFCFKAEGQILKKLKEKVKEAAQQIAVETEDDLIREIVPCELYDKNCIETAKSEGKEVVITNEKVEGKNGNNKNKDLASNKVKDEFEKNTRVEVVGTLDKSRLSDFEISEDGSYFAVPGFIGSRQTVLINGKEDLAFDKVLFKSFQFSPSGGSYAYMASNGNGCFAVLNGKISEGMRCQSEYSRDKPFSFSADGKDVVYRKFRGDRTQTLVVNGKELSDFQTDGSPFYFKGGKIFYVGKPYNGIEQNPKDHLQQRTNHLYINHKPGPAYLDIKDLQVSDDGERFAYQRRLYDPEKNTGGMQVIVNGKEGKVYPQIHNFTFDNATGAIFYIGESNIRLVVEKANYRRANEAKYVFDNKIYLRSETGFIIPSSVTFSSNGKRHAFITEGGSGMHKVWVDGKPSLNYEKVGKPFFTGNSEKVIFQATSGGQQFVVVNGEEFGPYKYLDQIFLSDKGGSYAFIAGDGTNRNFYVNGKISSPADHQTQLIFSSDGSRYAYFNKLTGSVVVDGILETQKPYYFSDIRGIKINYSPPQFLFSPKGNRLAYLVRTIHNNQYVNTRLIVDDKEIDIGNNQITYPVFSPDGKHIAYLQSVLRPREPKKWQLYINMKPGPIIGDDTFTGLENTVKFIDDNTLQVIGFDGDEVKKYTLTL